jgi:hypothetical protein
MLVSGFQLLAQVPLHCQIAEQGAWPLRSEISKRQSLAVGRLASQWRQSRTLPQEPEAQLIAAS